MTIRWRCVRSPIPSSAEDCSRWPGVSQVTPIGGAERQFQVIAHPDQLRANNIPVNELLDAVRGASQNTSAGIYMEGPQEYVLQTIGRVRTPEEIGESVVALRGDRSVLIRNIADVREGPALKRGEGSRNGRPAVIVGVQKQPGANTVELTARLDQALDGLQQELPAGMTIDRRIFRQSDFIEVAVENVIAALRDGGLLVVVIVVFFLANLRAAAITLTAIPLSLAAAVLVLRAFDATINTMTLGGMAIAIGALVDDAIIDVENVVRRLRENASRPLADQRPAADVVRDATLEIRTSIVFATIIIVLVFLPIFGLSGVEGRLMAPLAVAYIVALVASLGVAIVVTPALELRVSARRAVDPERTRRLAGACAQGTFRQRLAARARSSAAGDRSSAAVAGRRRRRPSREWARRSCRNSTKGR